MQQNSERSLLSSAETLQRNADYYIHHFKTIYHTVVTIRTICLSVQKPLHFAHAMYLAHEFNTTTEINSDYFLRQH